MAFGSLMNQSIADSDFEYAIIRVTGPSHGTSVTMTFSGGGQNLIEVSNGVWEGKASSKGTYTVSAGSLYTTSSVVVTVPKIYKVSLNVAVSSTLNNNSWNTISNISSQGLASRYWSVGDTKRIVLNGTIYFAPEYDSNEISYNNLSVDVFIVGINHNSSREGNNLIHFQMGKINGALKCFQSEWYGNTETGGFCHSRYASTSGGWANSLLRNKYLTSASNGGAQNLSVTNTYASLLPSVLKSVMLQVLKYTDCVGPGSNNSSNIDSTYDKFFVMSEYELFGKRINANQYEQNYQKQYAYYSAGNSKNARGVNYQGKLESTISGRRYWLRSPSTTQNRWVQYEYDNDSSGITQGNYCRAVCPCFCV